MNTLLTLDYELFLGEKTGTVRKCLMEPMNQLIKAVAPFNTKFTIFVDAAYLYRLHLLMSKHNSLQKDYNDICQHLNSLQKEGHDIQLHIHPQWYFSNYDGYEWHLDTQHYKLCDVEGKQITYLFQESKSLLDGIIGKKTFAFRAGGFSAQPTDMLRRLFRTSGIALDTSVCPGISYNSDCQKYDYIHVPNKSVYRFSMDICKESLNGEFIEVPISMIKVSPMFHWKLAMTRIAVKFGGGRQYKNMGDGLSVKTVGKNILSRMTKSVYTMAAIDGFKASLLQQAYQNAINNGNEIFCVLGHPKLATPYSLKKLNVFCKYVMNNGKFITITDCYER